LRYLSVNYIKNKFSMESRLLNQILKANIHSKELFSGWRSSRHGKESRVNYIEKANWLKGMGFQGKVRRFRSSRLGIE